jgi:hypothetical protein
MRGHDLALKHERMCGVLQVACGRAQRRGRAEASDACQAKKRGTERWALTVEKGG